MGKVKQWAIDTAQKKLMKYLDIIFKVLMVLNKQRQKF